MFKLGAVVSHSTRRQHIEFTLGTIVSYSNKISHDLLWSLMLNPRWRRRLLLPKTSECNIRSVSSYRLFRKFYRQLFMWEIYSGEISNKHAFVAFFRNCCLISDIQRVDNSLCTLMSSKPFNFWLLLMFNPSSTLNSSSIHHDYLITIGEKGWLINIDTV